MSLSMRSIGALRFVNRAIVALWLVCATGCGPGGVAQKSESSGPSAEGAAKPVDESPAPQKKPPRAVAEVVLEPATATDKPAAESEKNPEPVFRPDDLRTRHDDRRLLEAGIKSFESKRLKLYADIDENAAQSLPGLIDQLYVALEGYLGPMPPDRAGKNFQMTGYLIRDMALFREQGLIPDEILFDHGKHLKNEFWLREQGFEYYRRHLMIHEATHCFMTYMPDVRAPVWYLEGMAELFGAHRLDAEGQATFRVMPTSLNEFAGFGRIQTIRDDVINGNAPALEAILRVQGSEFRTLSHYSWSWGLCQFLDGSPRYHDRFQSLGKFTQGEQFTGKFDELFRPDWRDLITEWTLFSHHLQEGYELDRAEIAFAPGVELAMPARTQMVQITADRGWQSTRVLLEEGHTYKITATGQFSLGHRPRPWISEPQGITFRYAEGYPVGLLLGCIRREGQPTRGTDELMLRTIPLGREREFQAEASGTLYLRLNDSWDSLHDNRGLVDVTIREVDAKQ